MKGIGLNVYKRGADDAIRRLESGERRVTESIYGYRFWATSPDGYNYTVAVMTDTAYRAGVINGEIIGYVIYPQNGGPVRYQLYKPEHRKFR